MTVLSSVSYIHKYIVIDNSTWRYCHLLVTYTNTLWKTTRHDGIVICLLHTQIHRERQLDMMGLSSVCYIHKYIVKDNSTWRHSHLLVTYTNTLWKTTRHDGTVMCLLHTQIHRERQLDMTVLSSVSYIQKHIVEDNSTWRYCHVFATYTNTSCKTIRHDGIFMCLLHTQKHDERQLDMTVLSSVSYIHIYIMKDNSTWRYCHPLVTYKYTSWKTTRHDGTVICLLHTQIHYERQIGMTVL